MLSAIITTLQALVVYQAHSNRQRLIKADIRQGLSEVEARQEALAIVDSIDMMVKRFITI
jgi:predicted ATP-dependent serine protease